MAVEQISAARAGTGVRVYRVSRWQWTAGIVLMAAGLFFVVAFWGQALTGSGNVSWVGLMTPVVLCAGAGVMLATYARAEVRLTEDAIEVRSASGTKVLPFDKILGRRRYVVRGDGVAPDMWHLVIEPSDDRFPKLDLEDIYGFDRFFREWFEGLPDLDTWEKVGPKPSNFGLV